MLDHVEADREVEAAVGERHLQDRARDDLAGLARAREGDARRPTARRRSPCRGGRARPCCARCRSRRRGCARRLGSSSPAITPSSTFRRPRYHQWRSSAWCVWQLVVPVHPRASFPKGARSRGCARLRAGSRRRPLPATTRSIRSGRPRPRQTATARSLSGSIATLASMTGRGRRHLLAARRTPCAQPDGSKPRARRRSPGVRCSAPARRRSATARSTARSRRRRDPPRDSRAARPFPAPRSCLRPHAVEVDRRGTNDPVSGGGAGPREHHALGAEAHEAGGGGGSAAARRGRRSAPAAAGR